MTNRVTIFGQSVARVTYIAANLRDRDVVEIRSVRGHVTDIAVGMTDIAVASGPYGFVACLDNQPVLAFGVLVDANVPHLGAAWGYGTDKAWRSIPTVGRFIREHMVPALLKNEVRRVEVRVLADNKSNVSWLADHMGAKLEATLSDYGRNGETFHQFSWTQGMFNV